jgi:hypothetical protein
MTGPEHYLAGTRRGQPCWASYGIAPRRTAADCKAAQHSARSWLTARGNRAALGRRLPSLGPAGPRWRRHALTPATDCTASRPQRQL